MGHRSHSIVPAGVNIWSDSGDNCTMFGRYIRCSFESGCHRGCGHLQADNTDGKSSKFFATITIFIRNMYERVLVFTCRQQAALIYFLAEMIGATVGFGLLKMLIPTRILALTVGNSDAGFCATALNSDFTEVQGALVEFAATALLILLCCSCWDPRNAKQNDSVALKFGFAVAALAITFVSDPRISWLMTYRKFHSSLLVSFRARCLRDH